MAEWILSVSDLNEYVRRTLAADPALRNVKLRGEISNFKRHSSGHWYFTLKDERCRINAVMFRQNAMRMSLRPVDGMAVVVTGTVGLYSESGAYQIYCDNMRPEGVGSLYQQFEALKRRLSQEGLFDAQRKRPLPWRPRKVAVVTSLTGAVLHDIRRVSARRDPGVPLVLLPVQVQGQGAAEEIAAAIRRAGRLPEVDVIITGRGGGSMEDLWAFNEETVARAIAESPVPVVSAVGHETDVTIADFAADVRASTPSNAAELVVPDREETLAGLRGLRQHITQAMTAQLREKRLMLLRMRERAAQNSPEIRLTALRQRVTQARAALDKGMQGRITELTPRLAMARIRLDNAADQALRNTADQIRRDRMKLSALDPSAVLRRGYALVEAENGLVTSVKQANQTPRMTLRFCDGSVRVKKEETYGGQEEENL